MIKQQNNILQKRTKYLLTIITLILFSAALFSKTDIVNAEPKRITFQKNQTIVSIKKILDEELRVTLTNRSIIAFFRQSNITANGSKITAPATVIIDGVTIQVNTNSSIYQVVGDELILQPPPAPVPTPPPAKLSPERLTSLMKTVFNV